MRVGARSGAVKDAEPMDSKWIRKNAYLGKSGRVADTLGVFGRDAHFSENSCMSTGDQLV